MSYLARVVMLTLLLDEYSANSPPVRACIPPSTSIRVRLACFISSSFDASKTFLFCAVKIKHSLDGKFLEANMQPSQSSF